MPLEDFGSTHLWDKLNDATNVEFYKKAIDEIVHMQKADVSGLLPYDREFLIFEMWLMDEWYLEKYLNKKLSGNRKNRAV